MQQLDQVKISVYTKILVPLLAGNGLLQWLQRNNPTLEQWQMVVIMLTALYIGIGILIRIAQFIKELKKKTN